MGLRSPGTIRDKRIDADLVDGTNAMPAQRGSVVRWMKFALT